MMSRNMHNRSSKMAGPFIGFIMFASGAVMLSVGRKGLAGSGIILSPEGERKDLEPWNRSKGRQMQDMLEETQLDEMLQNSNTQKIVVKVRCSECNHLNDEEDKYCGECGTKMTNPIS